MAKIKFNSDDELNDWANEIQKELSNLKALLEEMKVEIANIKEGKKKQGTGFFD